MVGLASMLLVGCSAIWRPVPKTEYHVSVSSFGNSPYPPGVTFVIQPADPSLSKDDPEFQEYASYLQGVLEQKGFKLAANASAADFEATLNYGMGDPSTRVTSADSGGFGYAWTRNLATYNSRTSYAYDTTFQRTCQVVAYDLAERRTKGQWKQVWRTQMVSVGHSSDLRTVFPILLAAGYNFLGQDSYQQQQIVIYDDDPAVERVRGALKPPMP